MLFYSQSSFVNENRNFIQRNIYQFYMIGYYILKKQILNGTHSIFKTQYYVNIYYVPQFGNKPQTINCIYVHQFLIHLLQKRKQSTPYEQESNHKNMIRL